MELQQVIERIDKLEKKIDNLVSNYNELATNNALIAQDLNRILSFADRMHKIEIKVVTHEEKISALENRSVECDKKIKDFFDETDRKLQRLAGYGWGVLLMVLTQILTLLLLIFHDKIVK